MKIVIVGASGNVGTAVLAALQATGGHELVGVSRRRPPTVAPYAGVRWHSVDVADPDARGRLAPAVRDADAVINLAWGFQPGRDVEYLERVGVGGLTAVLAAAVDGGVPHLVHMSSVGAYSPAARGHAVDESWPTGGVASSAYSVQKAAAERILDRHEAAGGGPAICRLRPGLIMARQAGSSLLRYGLPAWLPAAAVDMLFVLPLDPTFSVPVVHARDVATAVTAVLERRATGAFNLSARSPLTPPVLADALRARPLPVPWKVLRAVVTVGWWLRLQRLDPGWIDLAFSVPLLDTERARNVLEWAPVFNAPAAIREAVYGMRSRSGTASPTLRRRSVWDGVSQMVRSGPITRRPLP